MIDASTTTALQSLLARESRSILAYVADAYPWTEARASAALDRLRSIIREEAAAVAALGQYLVRQRIVPQTHGSYATSFTSYNFVTLDFLLPMLIAFERTSLAELDRDLASVADAGARAVVERLRTVKLRDLAALEELAATLPKSAA